MLTVFVSIEPDGIALSSEVPGQFFFHSQGLFPGHRLKVDMVIKTWTEVAAVFLNYVRRDLVAFLAYITSLMLLKPFLRCLAGHTYIETFKHSIELGIGSAKAGVLGKDSLRKFDNIYTIG